MQKKLIVGMLVGLMLGGFIGCLGGMNEGLELAAYLGGSKYGYDGAGRDYAKFTGAANIAKDALENGIEVKEIVNAMAVKIAGEELEDPWEKNAALAILTKLDITVENNTLVFPASKTELVRQGILGFIDGVAWAVPMTTERGLGFTRMR